MALLKQLFPFQMEVLTKQTPSWPGEPLCGPLTLPLTISLQFALHYALRDVLGALKVGTKTGADLLAELFRNSKEYKEKHGIISKENERSVINGIISWFAKQIGDQVILIKHLGMYLLIPLTSRPKGIIPKARVL